MTVQPSSVVYTIWESEKVYTPLRLLLDATDAAELVDRLAHAGLIDTDWLRRRMLEVGVIERSRADARRALLVKWSELDASSGSPSQHHANPED